MGPFCLIELENSLRQELEQRGLRGEVMTWWATLEDSELLLKKKSDPFTPAGRRCVVATRVLEISRRHRATMSLDMDDAETLRATKLRCR